MRRVYDTGGVVVHRAVVLGKGAVFLGDLIGIPQPVAEEVPRFGLLEKVDHMGVVLRAGIQSVHHVHHEPGGEIAVIEVVGVKLLFGQVRELQVVVPAVQIASHIVHQHMAVFVVGVDQDHVLHLGQRPPAQHGILIHLAGRLHLLVAHAQRHLIEAGAVIPLVLVVVPAVPGGGIAVGKADVVGVVVMGLYVLVHQLRDRIRVQDAVLCPGILRGKGGGGAQKQKAEQQRGRPFEKCRKHVHRIMSPSL